MPPPAGRWGGGWEVRRWGSWMEVGRSGGVGDEGIFGNNECALLDELGQKKMVTEGGDGR
jgi:hypothetical protein